MQLLKNLFLVLVLGACPADWRKRDTILESTAITFTVIDMAQTRRITKSCSEGNPIIGRCGENIDYRVYFASAIALELLVARLLPADWRSVFIGAWTGAEGATIWDNWRESKP